MCLSSWRYGVRRRLGERGTITYYEGGNGDEDGDTVDASLLGDAQEQAWFLAKLLSRLF